MAQTDDVAFLVRWISRVRALKTMSVVARWDRRSKNSNSSKGDEHSEADAGLEPDERGAADWG
jgi:hypothetical protein